MTKVTIDRELLERVCRDDGASNDMAIEELRAILAALSAQQSAHVSVSRELLQDLRDLASDAVEHHRAAYAGYKQERQDRMDRAMSQANALLANAEVVKDENI